MNNSQSTEKFIREDSLIRYIDDVEYAYSSPRLNTLVDFFKGYATYNRRQERVNESRRKSFNSL